MSPLITERERSSEYAREQKVLYETRSEEVQEIIGRMPSWLVRYGVMVLGALLVALFTGAYYIKSPDKIYASISITADNPPVSVMAEKAGRIRSVRVRQNEFATKGQVLLTLESPISYEDVSALLAMLDTPVTATRHLAETGAGMHLGELQNPFQELLASVQDLQSVQSSGTPGQEAGQLEGQISENDISYRQLLDDQTRARESYEIDRREFETARRLFEKKAITPNDFQQATKKWLADQASQHESANNILHNRLRDQALRKQRIDYGHQHEKLVLEARRRVEAAQRVLRQQLESWETVNLIKAPVSGHVNLYSIWKENQYVQAGQQIMLIVPKAQNIVAKGTIGIANSGKVRIGQTVMINLASHPQSEYGYVKGTISYIASAPMDSVYSFDVALSNGLNTTANRQIFPQPQFFGTGEILTDDKNELQRILEQIKR